MNMPDPEKLVAEAIAKAREHIDEAPVASEVILRQILRCAPEHKEALSLLGLTLHRLKKYTECVEVLQMATEIDPENPDNFNNIALAYSCLDRYDRAIECMEEALKIKPDSHLFLNNLALQYRQMGQYEDAANALQKAIEINETPPIWVNLGGVFGETKQYDEALHCFNKAIELDPDCAAAHIDKAFSHHLMGDWKTGFEEYEWRIEFFPQMRYYRNVYDQDKRWRDPQESLEGKRLLIYGEQGLGDTIQALRWLPELKKRGVSHLMVQCSETLQPLVEKAGADEVIIRNIAQQKPEDLPEYDLQCCIMSLPYLLQIHEYSGEPYIEAKKFNVKESYPDTLNIGICWAGSPAHPNDARRSMYLKYFRPLSEIHGVKLFCVQKDLRPRMRRDQKSVIDYTEGCADIPLVDMTEYMGGFEDSANVVKSLDLVITVDTALLHLCGAVGTPCWGLIAYNPDWRWRADGEETVWYDSVRLFRQQTPGDWDAVMEKVKGAIHADYLQDK